MFKNIPLVLSRNISICTVLVDDNRLNLGLNLEFEAKKLTMLGCSHHGDDGGKFSLKAIDLVNENITPLSSLSSSIVIQRTHKEIFIPT